jgi:hypothetical protein
LPTFATHFYRSAPHKPEYAAEFVALLPELPSYFPESAGKLLIPILSSLRIPDNVVKYLTRHGVYCMVMGEDKMVLANFDEVSAGRTA